MLRLLALGIVLISQHACHARVNITVSLCTAKGNSIKKTHNGYLSGGAGEQGALFIRLSPKGYFRLKNSLSLDVGTSTVEYPGNLMRASQIEVHYRSRDILCLEQLTIQEGTYRIDLIQNWDQNSFVPKHGWESQTGRKASLWSNSCSPEAFRWLTKNEHFKEHCHSHLFMQHRRGDSQRCTNTFIRQRCGANSDCADTQKGPRCLCHKGYKWSDRTQSCQDIDECNSGSVLSPCKGNSKCHNTEGSFFCECPPGLTGEYCHWDIDECAEGTQVCDGKTSTCTNAYGSYTCTCKTGFRKDAYTDKSCQDIDECAEGTDSCWGGAECINLLGKHTCKCPDGFAGDGFFCEDFDECATDSHQCHEDAMCANRLGSYECICNDGFTGNGTHCEIPEPEEERFSILERIMQPLGMWSSDWHPLMERRMQLIAPRNSGLGCENDDRVWPEGCPPPSCDVATLEITNAWKSKVRRLNKRAADLHGEYKYFTGFAGTLTIPEEVVQHEGGFSILLSFDSSMFDSASLTFESFNLAIWDLVFDEQGRSGVLLRPKSDLDMIRDELQINSNQFQIIVDRLNEDAGFPKVYLWAQTDVDSSCIGNSTRPDMDEIMVDKHGRELETDQIRKISWSEDSITRLKRL
ncbi:Oidioi.mRNA.OKI2018_I69.PAR.g11661.t1.cds [Oikopleura dioica]|uniref:Oidioi.mRNA.OKI2018_I69.PAR.g11661.t1.cds n=1 Tax=Oikopleura dioica TaxID=34765 RepID=A0ABN7S326_OIKDI|nr:Oidioi.mRNA.OKI2018_I69.PAR.g11661.t1.cds [Oikopleura dioica]